MGYIASISPETVKRVIIDHATSGDNEIVAAVTGKAIRVVNFCIVSAGAATARFESAAGGTALTGQMTLAASTVVAPGESMQGHFQTAAGAALNLELSAAVSVDGWLCYQEV